MPWIDNKYIFPRAAAANMQEIWPWPSPEESPPPTPPSINPLLRVKPLLPQPDNGGDYMPPPDPSDPSYTGPGLLSDRGTTPDTFEGVGETARNIGKVAGFAGLLGGGPIAWGAEGLAGLSEMSSLNDALSTYAQRAGIQNVPQIGLWDAIAAGFNPFEDLRDVAQGYFFDPNELGDVWSDAGFDITEAEPEEGFPPGPGFNEMEQYAAPEIDWSPEMTSFLNELNAGDYSSDDSAGSMSGGGFGGDLGYGGPSF